MATLLRVLGCVCLLVASLSAQVRLTPTTTSSTALLAAYAMSNTLDLSGNGHTATLTATTTVPGRYADAQRFNGTSSRMAIPASVTLANAFTLEAWVQLDGNTRTVVGRAPREPAYWQALIYRSLDVVFVAEAGGFLTAGFTNTTGTIAQVTSATPIAPKAFHHIATTYDGARLALYLDGLLVASRDATGAVQASALPIEVGGSASDGGYFAGLVDDVRIYGRALTANEVAVDLATPVDTMREAVESWTLDVFTRDAPSASGGASIAQATFAKTSALCDLAPEPPPTGPVRNPTTARVSDPLVAGKECELTIASFVLGLPPGTGYTSIAHAHGATTVSGPSPVSNPFDRVAVAIPPAPPTTSPVLSR